MLSKGMRRSAQPGALDGRPGASSAWPAGLRKVSVASLRRHSRASGPPPGVESQKALLSRAPPAAICTVRSRCDVPVLRQPQQGLHDRRAHVQQPAAIVSLRGLYAIALVQSTYVQHARSADVTRSIPRSESADVHPRRACRRIRSGRGARGRRQGRPHRGERHGPGPRAARQHRYPLWSRLSYPSLHVISTLWCLHIHTSSSGFGCTSTVVSPGVS